MAETQPIHIVGGGMAGSEAAWQAAEMGVPVVLHEMRPHVSTFAHRTEALAEMVCSNSFRSDDDEQNAVGLLHWEMRAAGGLVMAAADAHALPAGGALAVDRDPFAQAVTARLEAHPRIEIMRGEIAGLPPPEWSSVIVATGPLTSPALAEGIRTLTDESALAFFDAIAPIVHFESVDLSKAWFQSRYDKGETEGQRTAYLNCPMDRETYEAFIDALLAADKTEFKDWERDTPYFEGCLPIEVMAERGRETLRFGPLKPVGLTNPHTPQVKPYAVVQLRRDNALGTLFNIVGFQTKMKHAAQTQVFRTIPGLEQAAFARLGGIHRNTFLNSPRLLDGRLRLRADPRLRFAGQITGVEGYVESAATGLLAGRLAAAERLGLRLATPPDTTATGALLRHITCGADAKTFQPMNVNFGLFPPLDEARGGRRGRRDRYRGYTDRAKADWTDWLAPARRRSPSADADARLVAVPAAKFRTRFAPSPTGSLHLGHAFSALTAWEMARGPGGDFLLRIEDTDRARCRLEYEAVIYDDLRWLGLRWPEPSLRQSEHLPRYAEALDRLAAMDLTYPCRCTRADISAALSAPQEGAPHLPPDGPVYPGTCRGRSMAGMAEGEAVRLDLRRALARAGRLDFVETGPAQAGRHAVDAAKLMARTGDVVLARKDIGAAAYHLAVVVDDAQQRITHVVRGEDLWDAAPLHRLLLALLGLPAPVWHHHRLIRDATGKRLAKRDDARALATLRAEGATPDDVRRLVGLDPEG